jgi:hypothetical protein
VLEHHEVVTLGPAAPRAAFTQVRVLRCQNLNPHHTPFALEVIRVDLVSFTRHRTPASFLISCLDRPSFLSAEVKGDMQLPVHLGHRMKLRRDCRVCLIALAWKSQAAYRHWF